MKDKKLKILLNVNFVLILVMMVMLFRFFMELTSGNDIDPVIIIGSLITIACLCYALAFFIWNLVLYIRVFFSKIIKTGYYTNTIIILIAGVIIPYILVALFCLIGFVSG